MAADIHIAWFNAHGGAFHKLLSLHKALLRAGTSCELTFASGPPRGLKPGGDVPLNLLPELAASGVRLVPRTEALALARQTSAKLLVTDAHHDPDLPELLATVAERGVRTAQLATLLGDFTTHGAQHLLVQHPLTLFYELEYNRTRESARLAEAERIYFTGNLFLEPTLNTLFGGYDSREAFCQRYNFNPEQPICLWLPSAPDVRDPVYGEVCQAVERAGMNLAIKLHPWEYAFRKHGAEGVDPWGFGKASDELWQRQAVTETDATWAFHYADAAILRASAMCLEMPFWHTPTLVLPSNIMPRLFAAQAAMVHRCSTPVATAAELATRLGNGTLPLHTQADYQAGQDAVRLPGPGNGYTRTVGALLHILHGANTSGTTTGTGTTGTGTTNSNEPATPPFLTPQGSLRPLKASYDALITPSTASALLARRRLRFEAGRLWRRLVG